MDPRWEFLHAPKFVDFTKLDAEDDKDCDSFFDVDLESRARGSQLFPGENPSEVEAMDHGAQENIEPTAGEAAPAKETTDMPADEPDNKERKQPRSNMLTVEAMMMIKMRIKKPAKEPTAPLKSDAAATAKSKAGPSSARGRTPESGGGPIAVKLNRSASARGSSSAAPVSSARENQTRPGKYRPRSSTGPRPAANREQVVRQETPTRRSLRAAVTETINNVRNSVTLKPKRLGTNTDAPRLQSQIEKSSLSGSAVRLRTRSNSPGMALPRTPDVMKRFKNKMAAGLANIQASEDFRVRKPNLSKRENIPLKSGVQQPVMKAPVLTRPTEFKFATARTKESRRRSMSVPDAPDFSRMLRSYTKTSGQSAVCKEITKPVPFPRVEESRKRRHSDDSSCMDPFKSVAEQINKFEKGTPDRFRSKPRGSSSSPPRNRLRSQSPKLTVPKTPQLSTKYRSRPNHVLSQAEREELEHEEAQRNQFHARQVGETLPKFKYGDVEKRPCTVPEPFNLAIASRPFAKPLPVEEQVEAFHSRPFNKKILQGPTGVPEKRVAPVVEPESPAFALKLRLASRRPASEPEPEPDRVIKAKPVPHWGVPLALPPVSKRATVPQPFSFAERDVQTASKKEERIKRFLEEEKEAREFHAQPVSKASEHPKLPEKKVQPPTKAEPFRLAIDERVESRLTKWQDDINKELETQRNAANFKASEPKYLYMAPFVPKPAEKHLIEISNFNLHTDRRAEERKDYELEKKKKEVDLEAMKRQREERKKREVEEEVARLRKHAVHKAQPIRGYKPVEIKPSDKPLTFPVSPRLSLRTKTNSTFNRTGSSNQGQ